MLLVYSFYRLTAPHRLRPVEQHGEFVARYHRDEFAALVDAIAHAVFAYAHRVTVGIREYKIIIRA